MVRKKTTGKMTVDDLTGDDILRYQPSFRDKDISITSQLAALDPPYSYERKQDGEVIVFLIRWSGKELFRLILNPQSIFYGYHRVGNVYDAQEGAKIDYVCSRIYNEMRFNILIRKMYDQSMGDKQSAVNQIGALALSEIPPHPLKQRREKVRQLKLEGASRKDISKAINESVDVVKKDLEWLRRNEYLP